MSDREIIVDLLRRVHSRLRFNQVCMELGIVASASLLFPLALKLWDFFSPLAATTVEIVLAMWALSSVFVLGWRIRRPPTFGAAAAAIDNSANLRDEIKTAYWFVQNPGDSLWIDAQIARAASKARSIELSRSIPRVIHRKFYAAACMLLLLTALNTLPLPENRNWFNRQGNPRSLASPSGLHPAGNASSGEPSRSGQQTGTVTDAASTDELRELALVNESTKTDQLNKEDLRELQVAEGNMNSSDKGTFGDPSGVTGGGQNLSPFMLGLATQLQVKLQREPLPSHPEMTKTELKPSEKSSSKLTHLYPNVSPKSAETEVRTPESLPPRYRLFIKKYFDTISQK